MNESTPGSGPPTGPPALFPQTTDSIWQKVQEASGGDGEALRKLCVLYHGPIRAYLLRSQPDAHQAEDLASGFIEFLLEKNRLEHFARGQVKFRSFLLKCLKGFLRDEWRKATADKRGGGQMPVPIDDVEVGHEEDFDQQHDREFALTIHRRVFERLAAEFAAKGEAPRFATLKPLVLGGDGDVSYAEIGARIGMTANHVKVAVLRLRGRYADLFREEVLHTTLRQEVDAEMRYLITLLADTEATTA